MPVNRSADCIVDHIILAQNIMFFTTTHKTARSLWQKHFKHRVGELTSWIFRCRSASEEEHETREDSSSSKEGAPSHGWAMRYLVLGGLQKDHTDFYEMFGKRIATSELQLAAFGPRIFLGETRILILVFIIIACMFDHEWE